MMYKQTDRVDFPLSRIGLGGHEYLPDGRSRGFNENAELALKPDIVLPGFGQEKRAGVLRAAYEYGVNFFDVTLDSEIEALGRNLKTMAPDREILVQCRPQGMVYAYDPGNRKMAQYEHLEAEVKRIIDLLGRQRIDILNFGFLHSALEEDSDYLKRIKANIEQLKAKNLIRYASADTFSGESTYMSQIECGCFDSIFINLNFADSRGLRRVIPSAFERGMAVVAREVFMKGALFHMGQEAGITDRDLLARAALKWVLSHREVTTAVVGADDEAQLANSISVLQDQDLDENERAALDAVRSTEGFREYTERTRAQFGY